MKMKHVVFYINSMSPAGGIERVVSTLANELCKHYRVSILVKDDGISFYPLDPSIDISTINTFTALDMGNRLSRCWALLKMTIKSIITLRSHFKKTRPDYIYVTSPLAFWEAFLTMRFNKKIIASEHGSRVNYNIVYRLLKYGYIFSSAYCIPTMDDYKFYANRGFPAVYTPHLRPNIEYKMVDITQKRVLNVGRFTGDKRQLLLLSIWRNILNHFPELCEWQLILVGAGELELSIRDYISEHSLSNNVQLYPPQSNIEEIYTTASIFALSSSSEGFGMVLLEAISFGIPVIAFDCPSGPKDIIDNEVDGFLVANDDIAAYELALVKLMTSQALRLNMSNSGFDKAAKWNDTKIVSEWMRIL